MRVDSPPGEFGQDRPVGVINPVGDGPGIGVDGDRANATWALEDLVIDTDWDFLLFGAAFYEDTYERRDGRWQILHTGYRRTFEMTLPTASVEGMRLTASWWATGGRSSLPVA